MSWPKLLLFAAQPSGGAATQTISGTLMEAEFDMPEASWVVESEVIEFQADMPAGSMTLAGFATQTISGTLIEGEADMPAGSMSLAGSPTQTIAGATMETQLDMPSCTLVGGTPVDGGTARRRRLLAAGRHWRR